MAAKNTKNRLPQTSTSPRSHTACSWTVHYGHTGSAQAEAKSDSLNGPCSRLYPNVTLKKLKTSFPDLPASPSAYATTKSAVHDHYSEMSCWANLSWTFSSGRIRGRETDRTLHLRVTHPNIDKQSSTQSRLIVHPSHKPELSPERDYHKERYRRTSTSFSLS